MSYDLHLLHPLQGGPSSEKAHGNTYMWDYHLLPTAAELELE